MESWLGKVGVIPRMAVAVFPGPIPNPWNLQVHGGLSNQTGRTQYQGGDGLMVKKLNNDCKDFCIWSPEENPIGTAMVSKKNKKNNSSSLSSAFHFVCSTVDLCMDGLGSHRSFFQKIFFYFVQCILINDLTGRWRF